MASPQRAPQEAGPYFSFQGELGRLRGVTLRFPVRRDDICAGGNKGSLDEPVWSVQCVKGDGKTASFLLVFV